MSTTDEVAEPTPTTTPEPKQKPKHSFIRRLGMIVLLVVATVLVPVTILAIYTDTQLTDTQRYVSTVTPVAKDPAVQAYVADTITARLDKRVNVDEYVREKLPTRAKPLVTPIAVAMKAAIHDAVLKAIQSDKFQEIWVRANERTHAALVKVLKNERGSDKAVHAENSKVNLDLSVLGDKIQARLDNSKIDVFSKIPADKLSGQVKLFDAKGLYQARQFTSLLEKLTFVLPFVLVACWLGIAFLARNRRRGFMWCTFSVVLGVTVLAVSLGSLRSVYLDHLEKQGVPREAAAAAYDALASPLHTSIRAGLALALVVLIAAIFAGPSKPAIGFRNLVHREVTKLGSATDGAGWTWLSPMSGVKKQARTLRIGLAVVAFAVFLFWPHPTGLVILSIALVLLLLLAIIEFFARDPNATLATDQAAATG